MMVQFYRPGQSEGGLYVNDRRQHDRSPDYTGKCLLTVEDCEALLQQARAEGGATLWINAWQKQGRNGAWFSLAPRAALASQNNQQQAQPQQPQGGYQQPPQQQPQGGYQSGPRGRPQQQPQPQGGQGSAIDTDEIPF